MENEDNIPEGLRKVKRKIKGNQRTDSQKRKNSGTPYKTLSNGNFVPGKNGPSPLSCQCQFACRALNLDSRISLFRKFWELGNYIDQQNYLLSLIEGSGVKRRRVPSHSGHQRQNSYSYYLPLPGKSLVQVCRNTFCRTFCIGEKRVKLLSQKLKDSNITIREKRGGVQPRRDNTWKAKMIDFIVSIPARTSHYGREKSDRKYLSPDLNVQKLHAAFLAKYSAGCGKPPVSRQWFNTVFKKYFRLSFGPPRVDTCPKCDLYAIEVKKAKNPQDKKHFELQRDIHQKKAEAAQTMMSNECKLSQIPDAQTTVISYDLQKQFYLPALTHTQMYYSRQLTLVNLGIHLENDSTGFFYLWNETVGKRGCNEIGTCIYDYATEQLREKKPSAVFWSDNCGGQNKNQGILSCYIALIAKGIFQEIHHKFPQCGHTYLSCDRDFALIEKSKKGLKPEVPRDIVKVIVSARNNKKPFLVKEMTKFYDWMCLAKQTLDTRALGISQVVVIRITASLLEKGLVEVKNVYSEIACFRKVKVFKEGITLEVFKNLDVVPDAVRVKPWASAKIKDIENFIPFVKPKNEEFYKKTVEKMKQTVCS